MILPLLALYSDNNSLLYYTALDNILSSEPTDASRFGNQTNLEIRCNNTSQFYKLDTSNYENIYIKADLFCVINITGENKKIKIDGPAQVYITGNNNTIYNEFNLSKRFSHPLVLIDGIGNNLKIIWNENLNLSYNVATAIVNDPKFITSDPGDSNFKFNEIDNSSFVGDIGPFIEVNISLLTRVPAGGGRGGGGGGGGRSGGGRGYGHSSSTSRGGGGYHGGSSGGGSGGSVPLAFIIVMSIIFGVPIL